MGTKNNNVNFTPIIIYNNAETDRLQILTDNKKKAGVYLWTHKESGKRYVGSAVDLSKRLRDYFSQSFLERFKTMYIYNAILTHNYSAFSLSILEYVENKELLIHREQFWIDEIDPEYNILKFAGSSLGYKHTEEAIAKMSEAKKGENSLMFGKTGEKHPFFGKIHSEESKAKISLANSGKTHLPGTIAKISEALSGENNPMSKNVFVYRFDPETKETILYKSFDTCIEAASYFNCSRRNISRYLDKNKLYKKQWVLSSN